MKVNSEKKEIYSLIVEAAHTLFIEHGIKDVKMDDIAARLSISKRTIYELFKDKEELLLEVLKFQNDKMSENGREIVRNSSHILEIILKLFNLHFKRSTTNSLPTLENTREYARKDRARRR